MRRHCKNCGTTFVVRPEGVTQARATKRTKALALVWYMLGLSYDGVVIALEAQGMTFSKAAVYGWVQRLWEKAKGLRKGIQRGRIRFMGCDGTIFKVKGRKVPVQFGVDLLKGDSVEIRFLKEEDQKAMEGLFQEMKRTYGVEVITTDDAGAYRAAAREVGLPQQLCISHARKSLANRCKSIIKQANVEEHPRWKGFRWELGHLRKVAKTGSRKVLRLGRRIYQKYRGSPVPQEGQTACVEYRMYLLGLKIMEEWPRIFTIRQYKKQGAWDGTNNGSERAIGLGGKIRYRMMRGFQKRKNLERFLHTASWLRYQQRQAGPEGFVDLIPLFLN
jgi:transposase-like protein